VPPSGSGARLFGRAIAQLRKVVLLPARHGRDLKELVAVLGDCRTTHMTRSTSVALLTSAPKGYVASIPIADPVRASSAIESSTDGSRGPDGTLSTMITSRFGCMRNANAHST
jgi:hypothetical protein